MARAPNPGAPQRVSAHVLPKASSFAADDEDEKTTIESGGWEEEASTTVEQGEVADRIRALGLGSEQAPRPNTAITSTDGNSMADEPTVDDQRGNAALALLPPRTAARLSITQGNDSGQAIEVRPGKTYTIGRALDNDLVLTDVTVSRKHFDLRHENGSWVIADRGSGNGTLVNSQVEDTPFVLANGDVIEIGNTTFRFELPNGAPRVPPSFGPGDDEQSTMSVQPLSDPEPATPQHQVAPVIRPKTVPAPLPAPRPRATSRPPVAYALERPSQQPQAHPPSRSSAAVAAAMAPGVPGIHPQPPGTTLPLPHMATRPPMQPSALLDPPHGAPLTTLPGQGPPMQPAHPARLPFSYPGASDIPSLQPRGSRAMAVVSGLPPRDATTALVQPITYSNGHTALVQPHAYTPAPPLSRRTKMVLAGAGLALFAAIATIAIIKGTSSHVGRKPGDAVDIHSIAPPRPTVEPIRESPPVTPVAPSPARPITPVAPAVPPSSITSQPASTATPPPSGAAQSASNTTQPSTAAVPPPTTTRPPTTTQPPSATAPTERAATATPTDATDRQPPVIPDAVGVTARAPPIAAGPSDPSSATAKKPERTPPAAGPRANRPEVAAATRKPARRPEKRTENKPSLSSEDAARIEIDAPETAEVAPAKTDKKRAGRTLRDVKDGADALYRAKNFNGAAALLTQSLPAFSGADLQELKTLSAIYSRLGKDYNVGMAPGTKHTDAYVALRRALSYDRDVGSIYTAEIKERLVVIAVRAATQYMADKQYEPALQAVRSSESLGSTSPTNQAVRRKLETLAAELLRAASSEASSNPDEAKRKARQVQGMVEANHPLHAKAAKLLNAP